MANWIKARSGDFNSAANWSTGTVPGSTDDAIINAAGRAFTVTATTNEDVNSIQTSANATLFLKGDPLNAHVFTVEDGTGAGVNLGTIKVGDNTTLKVLAKIGKDATYLVNSGVISLNGKTGSSFLDMPGYVTGGGGQVRLSGGGSIVMSDSALNGIVDTQVGAYESLFLDNIDNTISGAGVIGDGGLTLGASFVIENATAGVINATGKLNPLILNAPDASGFEDVVNSGLIEATGKAGLDIASTTVGNVGTILAGDGSIVRLESAGVRGGVLATAGSGIILASGGSTIDGSQRWGSVTNIGVLQDFGETMYAQGPITNTGSIRLSDQVTGAIMQVGAAGLTLSGGGTVTLTDFTTNAIQGDGSGSALVNSDNTISGAGQIGGGNLGLTNAGKGVIDATGAYNSLRLYGPGLTFANAGLVETTGKAGLDLASITLDQTGGGALTVATGSVLRIENSYLMGGTLTNAAGGQVFASGGSTATGTTLVNQGVFSVVDTDTFSANGSISNSGTISLTGTASAGHLLATGPLSLGGGGKVLLGEGGSITGAAAADVITNIDNQITGDGELGGAASKLVNMVGGVIHETGATGMLIDAVKMTNSGLIEASGTGFISVLSTVTNGGTIQADKGSMISLNAGVANAGVLEANGGTLVVYQNAIGAGSAVINGGTLQFVKGFSENVSFTGSGGRLDLGKSQTYAGAITGFSATGGTKLDLADIKFVSAGEATFSGTASGGTLTVTDGTRTAHIALTGDYLGSSFHVAKDGSGGVVISATTPSAPPAPGAFVSAMAGLGGGVGAAAYSTNDHVNSAPVLVALPRSAAG